MAREGSLAGTGRLQGIRNGRKMRDSLPLWQGTEERSGPIGVSRRTGRLQGFRNGRKIRVPLPLWQGVEDLGGPGSASRKERPVPGLPQRQENAGFAAVVEWGGGPECRKERETGAAAKGGGPRKYGTAVLHGHSSRRASDGRIPETFHTETSAARISTAVTISTDSGPEVSTGQGVRVSAAG